MWLDVDWMWWLGSDVVVGVLCGGWGVIWWLGSNVVGGV